MPSAVIWSPLQVELIIQRPVWSSGRAPLALHDTSRDTGWMDALTALSLQIVWGADEALDEAPSDRTRQIPSSVDPGSKRPIQLPSELPRGSLASRAAESANAAPTIPALRSALANFGACPLAATATNLVFADGCLQSGVVVVDDTPGPAEDISGRPMAGPAGQLLDRMLASIGLDRSSVMIINLIPWRPPGGRPPTEAEIATCLPFLRRHLALLRPRIVVSLGALPYQVLSGSDATIRRLRGRWQRIVLPGVVESVAMMAMMHPAVLLRMPAAKKEAWDDLLALQQALKDNSFEDIRA